VFLAVKIRYIIPGAILLVLSFFTVKYLVELYLNSTAAPSLSMSESISTWDLLGSAFFVIAHVYGVVLICRGLRDQTTASRIAAELFKQLYLLTLVTASVLLVIIGLTVCRESIIHMQSWVLAGITLLMMVIVQRQYLSLI